MRCLYYLYMIRHWNKYKPFFFNTLPLILFPFSCSCIPLTYSCTPTPEPDGLDLSGAYLATRNCSGIQADQRLVLIRTICKKVWTYSFYLLAWLTVVSAFFLFCHSRLSLSVSLSLPPYLYRAGREVSFQMRRRGGLRCAVNIRVRVLFSLSSPFYCLPPPILLDSSLNRSLNLQVNPFSILLYSGLLSFPLDIFNLPHASHH